ncbi:MAG: hypothetical protein CVV21_04170 [Candidatus Goldiibacteriota bacterium HGW-Goldbacteria-1]|jgi:heptosyltransferase-2|nr:MAG: hypothetical protein CVV21_04170 [Candidatus Goldiibacteriota bacterium HGW-Goldbacteria-1]
MRKYVFKKRLKRAVMAVIDAVGSALFYFYGRVRKKGKKKRILALRLDQLGDMIQALPFFSELRRQNSGYEIHALCVKDCAFLLKNNPDIDVVHELSRSWFYPERKRSGAELEAMASRLRKLEFEKAYDLRGDIRSINYLVRINAGSIYGYGCAGGGFMLDKEYPYDRDMHEIDKNLRLLDSKAADSIRIDFPCSQADIDAAAQIINKNGAAQARRIIVHPFTRAASKMWGLEKFNQLIKRIADAGNTKIFVIGGKDDVKYAGKIQFSENVINCIGALPLGVTIALIKQCGIFTGNDSGPQYFAAYSGLKTCVIYGYTVNYKRWLPKVPAANMADISVPVECGPCEKSVCDNKEGHKCMELITVDMVWDRIKGWF